MKELPKSDETKTGRFSAVAADAGERVDVAIARRFEAFSRSAVQRLIKEEKVTVNGETVKAKYLLAEGDEVALTVPPPVDMEAAPEDIPLDVVFEDEDMIVVNKAVGMVVHPAPGAPSGTLVNALLHHCDDLSGVGGVRRPGIVHRIDKDTTGLIVSAKNDEAHRSLSEQIAARTAKRSYLALVCGRLDEDEGVIDAPIGRSRRDRTKMTVCEGGREARTRWRVERRTHGLTLIGVDLETGRTHQVRVHLAHIGRPVVGDPTYGESPKQIAMRLPDKATRLRQAIRATTRQMLHARRLVLRHPRTQEEMVFEAPPPEDFQRLIDLMPEAD